MANLAFFSVSVTFDCLDQFSVESMQIDNSYMFCSLSLLFWQCWWSLCLKNTPGKSSNHQHGGHCAWFSRRRSIWTTTSAWKSASSQRGGHRWSTGIHGLSCLFKTACGIPLASYHTLSKQRPSNVFAMWCFRTIPYPVQGERYSGHPRMGMLTLAHSIFTHLLLHFHGFVHKLYNNFFFNLFKPRSVGTITVSGSGTHSLPSNLGCKLVTSCWQPTFSCPETIMRR